MASTPGGIAYKAAWVRKRVDKARALYGVAGLLQTNRHFDSSVHAAYYAVFHMVIARAVEGGRTDLRVEPRIYTHRELPELAGETVPGVIVVTCRGTTENYTAQKAVLELQGIRRVADYTIVSNDQENGEKGYQLAKSLLDRLI